MPCIRIPLPGGGYAIAKVQAQPKRYCTCGRVAERLCDGPGKKPGKTCSKPLCAGCTYSPATETDYCPAHRPADLGTLL